MNRDRGINLDAQPHAAAAESDDRHHDLLLPANRDLLSNFSGEDQHCSTNPSLKFPFDWSSRWG